MIGLDTNVLVYAADESTVEHARCRELLSGAAIRHTGQLCVPWSVVYEFLRVVTHPAYLRLPWSSREAWGFTQRLLEARHVSVLGSGPGHAAVAARMLAAPGVHGNLVHDAHIAAVLVEHGIHRIYTRDQDFHRFPGIEVVDPLA